MRNRAFTLIELLVVIGIIALLASIALPAYRGVQERAQGAKDMNNLRQIGIGFSSYLNDHDMTMFDNTTLNGSSTWPAILTGSAAASSYVQDTKVFLSPFDRGGSRQPTSSPAPVSYGINSQCVNPPTTNGVKLNTVTNYTHPSSLMIMMPNCTLNNGSLVFKDTFSSCTGLSTPPSGMLASYTLTNALYGDWHVSTINVNTSSDFKSTTSSFWNPGAP